MATEQSGTLLVDYNPQYVNPVLAKDIVNIADHITLTYPKDFFYNIAYPHETFYLTKNYYHTETEYTITFQGYSNINDPYLEFTKSFDKALKKKHYYVSIVFLDKKGRTTFKYSNRNYWIGLLKNNIFTLILLPIIVILTLKLGNYLSDLAIEKIQRPRLLNAIQQLMPLIGFPITLVAFKIKPMIKFTMVINSFVVLLTVFLFYFCSGNGLVGSLVLLVLFVLNSIQNSL